MTTSASRTASSIDVVARSDWGGALQWRMKAGAQPSVTRSAARESMRRYWFNRSGAPLPVRLEEAASADGAADDLVDPLERAYLIDPSQTPDTTRIDRDETLRPTEN